MCYNLQNLQNKVFKMVKNLLELLFNLQRLCVCVCVCSLYLLSDQDCRALQRHAHHLMRVPCDRVGPAKFNICLNVLR